MHIVITGGSRGIGAAAVRHFASAGHQVSFFYAASQEKAALLAQETGARAIQCDVSDGAAVEEAFSSLPPADVLINNAGISHVGLINQITHAEWDRLFAVNVNGAFHCIRAALGGMLQKQSGCILNVSSMWGEVGASCEAAYSATKGALIALTKALAKELGPSHIRVNAITPGVIQTDMCSEFSEDTLRCLAEETPLQRLGTPEDVVQAMDYLIRADFVTGQILGVSGGYVI